MHTAEGNRFDSNWFYLKLSQSEMVLIWSGSDFFKWVRFKTMVRFSSRFKEERDPDQYETVLIWFDLGFDPTNFRPHRDDGRNKYQYCLMTEAKPGAHRGFFHSYYFCNLESSAFNHMYFLLLLLLLLLLFFQINKIHLIKNSRKNEFKYLIHFQYRKSLWTLVAICEFW